MKNYNKKIKGVKNYIYSMGLSTEEATVLVDKGPEAVMEYFSNLRRICPTRALTDAEKVLYLRYGISDQMIENYVRNHSVPSPAMLVENYIYSIGLSKEDATALVDKGSAAVAEYFSNLRKTCPTRALTDAEVTLYSYYCI